MLMWSSLTRYFISHARKLHTYVFKMDKAYLRHVLDAPQFELSFKYTNLEAKVDRQFNFTRQLQEPVKTFLDRVTVNVDKIIGKKNKKKKQKTEENDDKKDLSVKVSLLVNESEVNGENLCEEVFKQEHKIVLKINEAEFEVIVDSPWVETLALPKSMLAGFPVYPVKLEHSYTDIKASEMIWYKSEDKKMWTEVGKGFFYEPNNTDINCFLKFYLVPKKGNLVGPGVEAVSDEKVEAGPGLCPFENRHKFTKERCSGRSFRVVCYNILADLYCDSDYARTALFPYCPPYALALDYRKQLYLKEIIGYNGDIMCLQEVDEKVYNYDLVPILSTLGYDSTFSLKGGLVAEGVACFYNKNRFELVDSVGIELSRVLEEEPVLSDIWTVVSKNQQLKERVLDRHTVLQIVLLKSLDNENNMVVIGNTHLYFHPDADHIRLLQGAISIKLLEKYFKQYQEKYKEMKINTIFCGDLNSSPDCGIYRLLTEGSVGKDFKDWRSKPEEAVENLSLTQSFKMQTACGVPQATNFTAGFQECIDWIYYDTRDFELEQVIPFPSLEELTQHTALPSVVFPSDHIALVADIKLKR